MAGSRKQSKQGVLSDHKRVGKQFIPPFVHKLPALVDVNWVDRPLPELFWLAVLNEELGLHRGIELASSIAKEAVSAPGAQRIWYAPVSAYCTLNESQQKAVIAALESQEHIQDLRQALGGLVALYPECPLIFLYESVPAMKNREIVIQRLKQVMADLFDKTTKAATFMQASAIYMAFVTKRLTVAPNLSLANFPAIEHYPATEESMRIASSVRASISAFFGVIDVPKWWPGYFWNRGLEIDQCMFDAKEPNE